MDSVVREATDDDSEAVARVHEQSIRGLASAAYPSDIVSAWASGKDPEEYAIESKEAHFLVAEGSDGVIGFGELRSKPGEYFHARVDGEIHAIYVHPECARQGVGSTIYNELESEARRRELGSLGLWASVNAVEFYKAHGFEAVEEITHEFGGEVEGPAVEMKKTL